MPRSKNVEDMNRNELYQEAKKHNIEGRSRMKKDQLKKALKRKQ